MPFVFSFQPSLLASNNFCSFFFSSQPLQASLLVHFSVHHPKPFFLQIWNILDRHYCQKLAEWKKKADKAFIDG
jgi:hypothetical protein